MNKINEFKMSSNDDIFKVNYKSEKYKTIFNNINKIFGSNYLNYISTIKLTHPYLVELFIFLRKYQYYIHYIKINKEILCSFDGIDEPIQERILNVKQMLNENEDNICSIKYELLPKFKKSEINFTIPNDVILMEINFHVKLINEDSKINIELNPGTEILVRNLDQILSKNQINEINSKLSKLFDIFINESKEKNFKIINKFINYIENYLPTILSDDFKKKNENIINEEKKGDEWNQEEQDKLEKLLIKYKNIKSLKSKLKKISEEFETKTLKQINSRYKELALKTKNKNKNESKKEKNEIIEDKKEQEDIKKEKDEKNELNDNININIESNINEKKDKNEILENIVKKKDEKDDIEKIKINLDKEKVIKEEKKSNEENLPKLELNNKEISSISFKSLDSNSSESSKFYTLETTEDIIDAIINVYNKNYKDHDLSFLQEKSNDKSMSYYLNFNEYEEKEGEEEDDEEEENDEESDDQNTALKKKNNEILDLCLSSSLQPTISSENLELIKSIINLGDKYQINLTGVQLNNISIVQISNIKLLLKCSKCKKAAFESKYMKLNKQKNVFYMGTVCPRCQNEIFSVFISDFIHPHNLTNAGVCYISGGIVIDYLPSIYSLDCEKCGQSKTIKLRTGCLHSNDSNCRKCNTKLNFVILSSKISNIFISDLKHLSDIKITNFEKFNFAIKDDINLDNYVKKFDKVIQEGKELPDFGACKHYKHSLRWFRFSCCNKIFPCDTCHDESSDHNSEYAKTVLCGFCACEQSSSNKICQKCGKMFTKSEGGKKFWEGGKGCRDPKFMNARDSHKFTGLNKTISRRQQRKNQNQNNQNNQNKKK